MRFSYKKATQLLNFFVRSRGEPIGKIQAMKLVFFADRYHLRKYGSTITGDQYYAMEKGPVPVLTKDIAGCELVDSHEGAYAARFLNRWPHDHKLHSVAETDLDVLSETEQEAAREVWNRMRDEYERLSDISHLFPEWKKHEAFIRPGLRREMKLEDFLEDAPSAAEFEMVPLTKRQREVRREHIEENAAIETLFG